MAKLAKLLIIFLCSASATLYAQTENDSCIIYVPNALTISGDCFDCHLLRIGTDCDFKEFKFLLYNRWGNIVFETTDLKFEYEPEGLQDGVYFYRIEGNLTNGTSKALDGTIVILR